MIRNFEIHPKLQDDCHELGVHASCRLLLHRNAALPWYIVVPETAAGELHELHSHERLAVARLTDALALFLKSHHKCQRSNVAAIGNRVPQLHIHVVGRWEGDPCWPEVVWGNLPPGGERSQSAVEAIRIALFRHLAKQL